MKTILKSMLTLGLLLFLTVTLNAQNTATSSSDKQAASVTTATTPGKFIDNNKNGICDNWETRQGIGHGKNFVDKNGDGICDNNQNCKAGKGNGNCCGQGYHHGNCNGQGKGNCCGNKQCCGKGNGQGYQHRHGMGKQNTTTPQPSNK